jgi:4'-phosphopantetheinyl transferase EntD
MLDRGTSSHQKLQASVQAQLGPDLVLICSGVDGDPQSLWPEEREAISRAIPRRQREFAAGRAAARAAMRQLGWPECPIPVGEDRSPIWPEGLVGSISHSGNFCVAAVAKHRDWGSVGIDIEDDHGIEPDLWPSICSLRELRAFAHEDIRTAKNRVTRLFSAKEAFFKWRYPGTLEMLDFQDVEIELHADGSSFRTACHKDRDADFQRGDVTGRQFFLEGQILSLVVTEYQKMRGRPLFDTVETNDGCISMR